MNKIVWPLLTIILSSCILYGSGIKTISGNLTGTLTANIKVGVFDSGVSFSNDNYVPAGGEPDVIFSDHLGNEVGDLTAPVYTPVIFVLSGMSGAFSLTLPDDPDTIECLIAWDDLNADDLYDFDTEAAYLPVKVIDTESSIVNSFSSIDVAESLTYIVNYTVITSGYTHQDDFDAIGADGFNFVFD